MTFVNIPPIGGGGSGDDTLLRGKKYASLRFYSISTGTSGTLTKPASCTIKMDGFGSGADCAIVQEASGKPTDRHALTSANEIISATLDGSGNWVLSGAPSAYPVSLVYLVEQNFEDFDSTSSDILEYWEINNQVNIQSFPSSGTWNKPPGAKMVRGYLVSGGGGGGSGAKYANSNIRCGGGGGAAGTLMFFEVDAAKLSSSETVTIGAGGAGGASQASNTSNGNNGGIGGTTSFGSRYFVGAGSNSNGKGGTLTTGLGGVSSFTVATPWTFAATNGAAASTTGAAGSAPSVGSFLGPTSGGSGGGVSAADAASAGGAGQTLTSLITSASITGGTAGAISTNGGTGNGFELFTGLFIGSGGGGGGSSIAGNAGNGGNGIYGGGGGGGGAAVNSVGNSGAGGNGGDGYALIITYF